MFVTGSALVDKKQTARVNALTTGVGKTSDAQRLWQKACPQN